MYAGQRISRRTFLRGSAAGAGMLGLASVVGLEACSSTHASPATPTVPVSPSATPVAYRGLHSRPDLNGAPALRVSASTSKVQDGYLCLTPQGGPQKGPAIFDSRGRLIWFQPSKGSDAANLQVTTYKGRPALAWFEGDVNKAGYGQGAQFLYNDQYQQVARIEAGGGGPLDLHDFVITPQGTALVDFYTPRTVDLTPFGGKPGGTVFDCTLQEIDIENGQALFSWDALDHIDIRESVTKPPTDGSGYDYFHLNAYAVDRDNNLLLSARNTSALYKIDRKTGAVLWRFPGGGNGGSLPAPVVALAPASESFWFQHDVRRNADGSISIFDDGGGPYHHAGRGLVFDLDEKALTATIRKAYGSSMGLHISYQGSFRQQPNGNWLAGWGDLGRLTEFTPEGDTALDVAFTGNSYRALPATWRGRPTDKPAIAVKRSGSKTTVWASWNGATDVARWRVLGGADATSLASLGTFEWHDFETSMSVASAAAIFAVEALDASGETLARSAIPTV